MSQFPKQVKCSFNDQPPPWLRIEEAACNRSSLTSLLCLPFSFSSLKFSNNVIIKNCLKVWCQFRRHFILQTTPLLYPVHSNPLFPPSFSDKAFAAWVDHGIVSIKDLYIDGTFVSFEQLTQVFNLPRSHFFQVFADLLFCPQALLWVPFDSTLYSD